MNEWQLIESAPKDGTAIAVYLPWNNKVCTANWNGRTKRWTVHWSNHFSGGVYTEPSHWVALPPPPEINRAEPAEL